LKTLEHTEILVTGGAGFIGSHLCQTLLEQGAKVTAYDNLSVGKIEYVRHLPAEKIRFVRGDIRDSGALEETARNCETIFHLAAQTSVPFSMKNPKEDFGVNVSGTLNVLEIARKRDARIIFASTAAVYGNAEETPTPEDYPAQPISFYGLSKRVAEEYCQFYHETYGTQVVLLRIFNVYGLRGHGVIPDFIDKLKKTPHRLEVLGTGEQSRDFIHVSDVVRALVLCAQHENVDGQAYNIGSGTTTSVIAIAEMIIALLNLREVTKLSFAGGQAWEGDAKLTHADIRKLVGTLSWRPLVTLRDGLEKLLSQEGFKTVSKRPLK
jgi:UDP-glucose 4-epimerase